MRQESVREGEMTELTSSGTSDTRRREAPTWNGGSADSTARREIGCMDPVPDSIPEHRRSTYLLLRSSYPEGIPEDEVPLLVEIMADLGMSDRSIAAALACHYEGPGYTERSYIRYSYVASAPKGRFRDSEKSQVIEKLKQHGYEQWAQED